MKKPTNSVIVPCSDAPHSPICFGTLKCHNQGDSNDPAEIGAQCCRNLKDRLKYMIKKHRMYINVHKRAHWWELFMITHNFSRHDP
jgi:hypothetical protein